MKAWKSSSKLSSQEFLILKKGFFADEFECNTDICFGISSGTAERVESKNLRQSSKCRCKCFKNLRTFREDSGICVEDIRGNEWVLSWP